MTQQARGNLERLRELVSVAHDAKFKKDRKWKLQDRFAALAKLSETGTRALPAMLEVIETAQAFCDESDAGNLPDSLSKAHGTLEAKLAAFAALDLEKGGSDEVN